MLSRSNRFHLVFCPEVIVCHSLGDVKPNNQVISFVIFYDKRNIGLGIIENRFIGFLRRCIVDGIFVVLVLFIRCRNLCDNAFVCVRCSGRGGFCGVRTFFLCCTGNGCGRFIRMICIRCCTCYCFFCVRSGFCFGIRFCICCNGCNSGCFCGSGCCSRCSGGCWNFISVFICCRSCGCSSSFFGNRSHISVVFFLNGIHFVVDGIFILQRFQNTQVIFYHALHFFFAVIL